MAAISARADRLPGLRRSLLYVPATNARAIEKARTLPCDTVILDLEDSVAPHAKAMAREAAVAAIRQGFGGREVALRCNGLDTPWGEDDLKAAAAADPDVVVLPKVTGPDTVLQAAARLPACPELWAMIETCGAVLCLSQIAATAGQSPLGALLVGTNDLAAEMRCRLTTGREALAFALSQAVLAARAHGLMPLDGPFIDLDDVGGLESQCRHAAELGFDGKSLIHPAQIEVANRAFSPTAERIAWARAVIAAFEAQPHVGVLKVDGRMTERLHLREAERVATFALRASG
jgi:citrate lyase subunit beta/citryl-CoA lyase